MLNAMKAAWALFLGIALIMLGNGLQGSLLSLRASFEGFDTNTVGLVMTGYFVGFLGGSIVTPKVLLKVGHVRTFAALASLASTAVLAHILWIDPFGWFLMRLVTGFAYAGLYVVAECWLNDRATNETRGQLLSIYMVVMFVGVALGQLLLNVSNPYGHVLFILVSILVSIALIPILLSASPAPEFIEPESMALRELYRVSPLGMFGALATGLAHGAIFSMGAIYAQSRGFNLTEISIFMGVITLGAIIMQWPIGALSDRFDRRLVLTVVTTLAAGVAFLSIPVSNHWPTGLYILVALFGGLSLPMYSLCIAHTNDHLRPHQMVSASSSLVMMGGIGACFGPLGASFLMNSLGPDGFFWALSGAHGSISVFACYRMLRRAAVPMDQQGAYVTIPPRATPMATAMTEISPADAAESRPSPTSNR